MKTLDERKEGHRKDSENGSLWLFHRAIRKYGWEMFEWTALYQDDDNDREWMDWWEGKCIREYRTKVPNGYNMTDGGEGGAVEYDDDRRLEINRKISEALTGHIVSEETRQKLSESNSGRVCGNLPEETRRKISATLKGKKKPPMSEETKQKIREARSRQIMPRGHKLSEETKQKIREARVGKSNGPHSSETKRKMTESQLKRWSMVDGDRSLSPECKAKISAALKGRGKSAETRGKLSVSLIGRISPMKGRCHSEETKRKIRESQIGKIIPDDQKAKMSASHRGKPLSEETKRKMSESQKLCWAKRKVGLAQACAVVVLGGK